MDFSFSRTTPGSSNTGAASPSLTLPPQIMQRALAVVSLAFAFSARALNRPVTAAAARVKRLSRDEEIKLADIAQRASRHKLKRDALAAELGRPPTAEEWAGRVKEHKCALARAQRNGRRARPGVEVAADEEDPAMPEMGPL